MLYLEIQQKKHQKINRKISPNQSCILVTPVPLPHITCHSHPGLALLFTANFQLPEEGQTFDKVEFVELEREEAQKLVEKYNEEGRAALPPPEKRWRGGGGGYNQRYSQYSYLFKALLKKAILDYG